MTGNPFAYLAQGDFQAAVDTVFPTGPAWPRDADSNQEKFRAGLADIMAEFHVLAAVLTEVESDPRQTTMLLPDWEQDYGLPDTCTVLGASLQQRRNTLLSKITALGGASLAYFQMVAAALGFTVNVRNGVPADGAGWQYTWVVTAIAATQETFFRVGDSGAGDYLDTFNNTELECRLNYLKPAHTVLIVNYV